MKTAILVALLSLCLTVATYGQCPNPDFTFVNGVCYYLSLEPKNWNGASAFCKSMGTYLPKASGEYRNLAEFLKLKNRFITLWMHSGLQLNHNGSPVQWSFCTAANLQYNTLSVMVDTCERRYNFVCVTIPGEDNQRAIQPTYTFIRHIKTSASE